jgi:hypothetical protein
MDAIKTKSMSDPCVVDGVWNVYKKKSVARLEDKICVKSLKTGKCTYADGPDQEVVRKTQPDSP